MARIRRLARRPGAAATTAATAAAAAAATAIALLPRQSTPAGHAREPDSETASELLRATSTQGHACVTSGQRDPSHLPRPRLPVLRPVGSGSVHADDAAATSFPPPSLALFSSLRATLSRFEPGASAKAEGARCSLRPSLRGIPRFAPRGLNDDSVSFGLSPEELSGDSFLLRLFPVVVAQAGLRGSSDEGWSSEVVCASEVGSTSAFEGMQEEATSSRNDGSTFVKSSVGCRSSNNGSSSSSSDDSSGGGGGGSSSSNRDVDVPLPTDKLVCHRHKPKHSQMENTLTTDQKVDRKPFSLLSPPSLFLRSTSRARRRAEGTRESEADVTDEERAAANDGSRETGKINGHGAAQRERENATAQEASTDTGREREDAAEQEAAWDERSRETCGPRPQAVLLLPGSFNPPTFMHLRMLELARDALESRGWDVIGAYMSPVNDAYGKKGLASAAHRVSMCELATNDSDFIMVDAWEALQPAYQRTLTVLQRIESALNEVNIVNKDRALNNHYSFDEDEARGSFSSSSTPTQDAERGAALATAHSTSWRVVGGDASYGAGGGGGPGDEHGEEEEAPAAAVAAAAAASAPAAQAAAEAAAAAGARAGSTGGAAAAALPPMPPPVHVVLVCGADLLESFTRPGVWLPNQVETILGQHGVVCVARSGTPIHSLLFDSDLLHRHRERILVVDNHIPNEISSSRVRKCISRGLSVRYLLPDEVLRYVDENGLYS